METGIRSKLTAFAALCAASLLAACGTLHEGMHDGMHAAHHPEAGKNRVVIQVSEPEPAKWNLALNNAQNIQQDLGAANVEIEIVTYGPGLAMLKAGSPVAMRVDEALMKGIKVVACENTMRKQKLTRDDLLKGLDYAPSGVVEIMRRQQQGWAYVRP